MLFDFVANIRVAKLKMHKICRFIKVLDLDLCSNALKLIKLSLDFRRIFIVKLGNIWHLLSIKSNIYIKIMKHLRITFFLDIFFYLFWQSYKLYTSDFFYKNIAHTFYFLRPSFCLWMAILWWERRNWEEHYIIHKTLLLEGLDDEGNASFVLSDTIVLRARGLSVHTRTESFHFKCRGCNCTALKIKYDKT